MILLVGLVLAAALVLAWAAWRRRLATKNYERHERARMPPELAHATLVLSEQYFRTEYPRPLGARFDQAYLADGNRLIVVDSKTRKRAQVWATDQIELSVQAAVLRHGDCPVANGREVAPIGYVRAVVDGRPHYLPVRLLSDLELANAYDRYQQLLAGDITPRCTTSVPACRKCAYREDCTRRAV